MANSSSITTWPGFQELDKRFEPYAIQLGWLAYSWNALHDALGSLFWKLTGISNGHIPLAIWNAVPNDRTQRGMVKALAQVVLADRKRELADILWVLAQADSFEERRNNALHSPLTFMIDPKGPQLTSKWLSGNARATKLKDKDLLKEFTWYGRAVNKLATHVRLMDFSLLSPTQMPWPGRPKLPALGDP